MKHNHSKIHTNRLKDSEITFIFCVNQMTLSLIFRNLFRTYFSKLRNWIGSIEMCARDTACIASFVKIG
jgi:hypothetical protein